MIDPGHLFLSFSLLFSPFLSIYLFFSFFSPTFSLLFSLFSLFFSLFLSLYSLCFRFVGAYLRSFSGPFLCWGGRSSFSSTSSFNGWRANLEATAERRRPARRSTTTNSKFCSVHAIIASSAASRSRTPSGETKTALESLVPKCS